MIEQSCGESLMFNPVSMVCDFDYKVTQIRPECAAAEQSDNTLVEDIFGTEMIDELIRQESGSMTPGAEPKSKEGRECSDTGNAILHLTHESDCTKFYHCVQNHGRGGKLVLKSCSPGTMFNPKQLICDWPINVYKIKPICRTPGNIYKSIPLFSYNLYHVRISNPANRGTSI